MQTIKVVEEAISNGIYSFEPPFAEPIAKPKQMTGCLGCLGVIAVGILVIIIASSIDESATFFDVAFLGVITILIGGAIWSAIMKPKWDREEKEQKEQMNHFNKLRDHFNKFMSLRERFYSLTEQYQSALSFDPNKMAGNLRECLVQLKSYIDHRQLLENTYIRPYI